MVATIRQTPPGSGRRALRLGQKALAAHEPAWLTNLFAKPCARIPTTSVAASILGYEKYDGRWVSPYAAHRLASGYVFHEKFGWVPAADLPRYERGERKSRGSWVDQAIDAKQHADIKSGWRVETEHYIVNTNRSLEAGVAWPCNWSG